MNTSSRPTSNFDLQTFFLDCGVLNPGARGDFVIWNATNHREVIQHYGANLVSEVFIRGRRVLPKTAHHDGPKNT